MLDIPDLNGLELEDAKVIVFNYVTALKKTQQAVDQTAGELKQWQDRVALASSKNREDLASQAREKADELSQKLEGLKQEKNQLEPLVEKLKQDLNMLKTGVQLNYDPDHLAAEIEVMMGQDVKETETKENIARLSVDEELEKIKREMRGDKGGDET